RAYRQTILDSRVRGTTLLSQVLAGLDPPPRVLLSASGVGFYGDTGAHPVDESAPGGHGFLPEVAQRWEASTRAAKLAGIRVCHLSSGLVLSSRGRAMGRMLSIV